jgi:tetratricopeptide (TPR) repeat protein
VLITNVVAMRSRDVGDYVYRVSQPALAMGQVPGVEVLTVSVMSPDLVEACLSADVLVLHLLSEDDLVPLLAERQRLGRPTVYEISDHFLAPADRTGFRSWFSDPAQRANALALIRLADAVQVTGPGLAEVFGALAVQTQPLANHMASIGPPPRAPGATVRIGWGGSSSHWEDLRPAQNAILEICRRHPQVVFGFMGDRAIYDALLSPLPEERRAYTPPGTVEDYYRFLETLDVGIAPLQPTPYNHCRSDVKFIEYASRGVAPVLAAFGPYLSPSVPADAALHFADEVELVEVLSELVESPQRRLELATRAQDHVRGQRMEAQHVGDRLAFYRSLLGDAEPGRLPARRVPLVPGCASYDVVTAREEDLVVAGIRAEAAGERQSARAHFEAAIERAPRYGLAWFWLGRSYELAGELAAAAACFERAAEAQPLSIRALMHLARVQTPGHPGAALATLERARQLAPHHAPVLEAAARLHEECGDEETATALYAAATHVNPFSGRAAAGLGRLYGRKGEQTRAVRALERAVELAPADVGLLCDCAEQLLDGGNVGRASEHAVRALELEPQNNRARVLAQRLLATAA